jgi:hypothetical protein
LAFGQGAALVDDFVLSHGCSISLSFAQVLIFLGPAWFVFCVLFPSIACYYGGARFFGVMGAKVFGFKGIFF